MATVFLFSYGWLQKRSTQVATFGRELRGHPDALRGFTTRILPIIEPTAVTATGETHYADAVPSANPDEAVMGTVFEISAQELATADEVCARYHRAMVSLESGIHAWVYIHGLGDSL